MRNNLSKIYEIPLKKFNASKVAFLKHAKKTPTIF